jgi:hypothetical protein
MNTSELLMLINKSYDCKLWRRNTICRLYFSHRPNVTIFLELSLIDFKIIKATPKCIYEGSCPSNQKWIDNYTLSSCEYINKVAREVFHLINPNITTGELYNWMPDLQKSLQKKRQKICW